MPLALCAIRREGEVLLLRRAHPPYRGCWGLPGGKMRFGETVVGAALREGREETGLDLDAVGLRGVATENLRDGDAVSHFLIFLVELRPAGGALRHGREGPLRWWSMPDLAAPSVIPSDRWMIETLLLAGEAVPVAHFEVRADRPGEDYRFAAPPAVGRRSGAGREDGDLPSP